MGGSLSKEYPPHLPSTSVFLKVSPENCSGSVPSNVITEKKDRAAVLFDFVLSNIHNKDNLMQLLSCEDEIRDKLLLPFKEGAVSDDGEKNVIPDLKDILQYNSLGCKV